MASLQKSSYLSKIWVDLALICIIIILCSLSSLAATTGNVTVALNAGTYNITKDRSGYDVIVMDGFSDRVETGNPMLPQKTFDVLLPADINDSSLQLKIISAKTRVLDGTYDIKPSPEWLPQTLNETFNETASMMMKNVSTYETDADYPENFVLLLPISQMRKWKSVPVDFMPFQYNPVTKKLTLHENVTIEISYSRNELPSAAAVSLADTVLDDVAPTKFINYKEMSGWYISKENAKLEPSAVSDYVIITTDAIEAGSSKLSSFIAHKQKLGYSVLTVTEDDFDSLTGQAPNHRAEKIRQWLKNNYISKGVKYVLLIGNPTPYENGGTDIPMKMCWPRHGTGSYEESPTDYFYADLTGNWDIDGDGYYGEWADYKTTGGVDLAADVYVGRIPVYSADYTTLDSILQKIIDYETSSDTAWRKSALLPMSFSDSSTDGAYLGEQMKDNYLTINGYSCWRMYQHGTSGTCTLNSAFSSEENLRGGSAVPSRWADDHFGMVAWWGHGNSQGAYVGYNSCSDGAFMLSSNAPSLDDDHPSHTYQCSCTNGYPEDSSNLQYAILKNGGITTTGATRVSWYYVGQTSFAGSPSNAGMGYEYMKLLAQGEPAGDALYGMKSSGVSSPGSYSEILMNFYDFCLDGDPSLSISPFIKSGSTTPGETNWKAYGSSAIYLDVDTSAAGFTSTPLYFASLGGNGYHWLAIGINAIYAATPTGFRLYLRSLDGAALTPANANSRGWYVQWLGVPATGVNAGSTSSGATNWKQYTSSSIYVDVDTSAAGFTSTPRYFTSLGGNGYHWLAIGINAIYAATPTGFRLYLRSLDGAALTPANANSRGWYVQWLGVPATGVNAGSTSSGATNWKQYTSSSIYVDVDTSAAGFTSTPRYFTSLGGNGYHWLAIGINAIYAATPTGFRLYLRSLDGAALTPANANSRGWYVQWLGES